MNCVEQHHWVRRTYKELVIEIEGYDYKNIRNLTTKHYAFLLPPHIYFPELNNNRHLPGKKLLCAPQCYSPHNVVAFRV